MKTGNKIWKLFITSKRTYLKETWWERINKQAQFKYFDYSQTKKQFSNKENQFFPRLFQSLHIF